MLDGIDASIRVPNATSINFGTQQQFAVTLWVKTSAATDSELVSKRGSGTAYPYNIRMLANGTVQFSRSDGTTVASVTSSAAVNDNAYHFVAAVREGTELKIYIDGTLSGTATDTTVNATINNELLRFGVGDSVLPLPLAGQLDDVRLYDATICDTQIGTVMAQP